VIPRSVVIAGLNDLRPQVQTCHERYRVPGTAMVKVRVKTARFPATGGVTTRYAFQLR
jgi:hypothetical protein